jgi:hypothetical protein
MKRSNALSGSALAPRKRSISAAGRRSCSTGGMNAARAICQNALIVKSSRHDNRQRTTVRRSTPTALASCRIRRSVTPCCIIDTSTGRRLLPQGHRLYPRPPRRLRSRLRGQIRQTRRQTRPAVPRLIRLAQSSRYPQVLQSQPSPAEGAKRSFQPQIHGHAHLPEPAASQILKRFLNRRAQRRGRSSRETASPAQIADRALYVGENSPIGAEWRAASKVWAFTKPGSLVTMAFAGSGHHSRCAACASETIAPVEMPNMLHGYRTRVYRTSRLSCRSIISAGAAELRRDALD